MTRFVAGLNGNEINAEWLAVWFTPEAIRESREGEGGRVVEWLDGVSDEQLAETAFEWLSSPASDRLWDQFHESIWDILKQAFEAAHKAEGGQ